MNNRTFECGICFESFNPKQIDKCTQIECEHIFHNKCLKQWCLTCVEKDFTPNCPLCRQDISGEYLDLLGIVVDSFYGISIISVQNTVNLFQYIIDNKLYLDNIKLKHFIERYPDEMTNIKNMLIGYSKLNSLRINMSF
jgi:hypothetical protein